jgi:hypothetical protein
MRSIVWSVHDVTPSTLDRAAEIVDLLVASGAGSLAVLVVPDGEWTDDQIATLRGWEQGGHVLAAHGWSHHAVPPRGLYHRLHSTLLSRDAAEHLGRARESVLDIVRGGQAWFARAGLQPPSLYVPPAWALGALPLSAFDGTPFRWVETLSGIYDTRARRWHHLPLVGFEADTDFRARSLRMLNAANLALGTALRRPVRAGVHPNDLSLLLARETRALIRSRHRAVSLTEL